MNHHPTTYYIPFTDEQKQQAASVDLEAFLQARGDKLIRSGHDKRLASDHSVTIRGNQWFDHAAQKGGNPISFLQTFYGQSYPEAMQTLLGADCVTVPQAEQPGRESSGSFSLPPRNADMKRAYAYLIKQRHLDREIISYFARQGHLYEDTPYHNAVFVGADEYGTPRHAHKRSVNSFAPPFRQNVEGSDPRYSFHYIGTDGSLFVFEAPIDMLSFITLHPDGWDNSSYVACCGTSIQPVLTMLELAPQVDSVFLCLDNDEAGRMACERMAKDLEGTGLFQVEPLLPDCKDWNEELVQNDQPHQKEIDQTEQKESDQTEQKESEVQTECQTFGP